MPQLLSQALVEQYESTVPTTQKLHEVLTTILLLTTSNYQFISGKMVTKRGG